MAARARERPDLPRLPAGLEPAPAQFSIGTDWYGLAADARTTLPEVVHDLELTECVWDGVEAGTRTFSGLRARDVLFRRCDLGGAVLDGARLTRVHFLECRLTGVNLSAAALDEVVIEGGTAELANFRASEATLLWAMRTSLKQADFHRATLRRCALLDCDLSAAGFDAATVDGLCLHGSQVAELRGARAFADANVSLDADQIIALGAAVLADLGVRVSQAPAAPA